jgi:hypothetical protein
LDRIKKIAAKVCLCAEASLIPLGKRRLRRPASKKLTYALLKKNPDRFAGTTWRFTGRIVEISEKNGITFTRLALDYYQNNVVFVIAVGESNFVENDVVDVLGTKKSSDDDE